MWLAGELDGAPAGAPLLGVVGIPLDATSISPSRARATPGAVRGALRRHAPFHAPTGGDLRSLAVVDAGDVDLHDQDWLPAVDLLDGVASRLRDHARDVQDRLGRAPDLWVVLGGDNAVTRPALAALVGAPADAALLTLDAHHDVRGWHAGPTNGTPVRGLVEDGLPGARVAQLGIGRFANSAAHAAWCEAAAITVVGVDALRAEGVAGSVRRHLDRLAAAPAGVYVDLDVDVLDAAFAPACPGARPGGLTPGELLDAAFEAGRHPAVRVIDVVEVDAAVDDRGRTVDIAAQCLLAAAAGLLERGRD